MPPSAPGRGCSTTTMHRTIQTVTTHEQLAEVVDFYSNLTEFVFDVETMPPRLHEDYDSWTIAEQNEWTKIISLDHRRNKVFWIALAGPGRADVIPMGHPHGEIEVAAHKQKYKIADPKKEGVLITRGPNKGQPYMVQRTRTVPTSFYPAPEQLSASEVFAALEPLFFSDRRKIGHNVQFDLLSIAKYYDDRIPPEPYGDTLVLASLTDENRISQGLKQLTQLYLQAKYPALAASGGVQNHPFSEAALYTMRDAKYTWLLWTMFSEMIAGEKLRGVARLEADVIKVLLGMRYQGVHIDEDAMDALGRRLDQEINEILGGIWKVNGGPFNVDSPDQLANFLYGKLELEPPAFTATGRPSMDKAALEILAKKNKVANQIVEYRKLTKVKGTYIEGLKTRMVDGQISANFRQTGTVTGRLSCVASDSLVEMPRDLVKYPHGVPITEVRPGDWVYAFDWKRELVLKQVKWVAQTGVRETVIVTAENSEGHRLTLRLTPDHLVRLRNGDWRPAGTLDRAWGQPLRVAPPRLMTMVRRNVDDGYVKFFPHSVARGDGTTGGGKSREHRWVLEQVTGKKVSTKADVHHVDGNRANNHPDNLEALTVAEHRGRRHIHPHWGDGRGPAPEIYQGPTDYRVVSIEPGIVEPVWDMEVEDVHNFIANGICVHNCSEPNLQNIPRSGEEDEIGMGGLIRDMFIPPPGYSMVGADYDQIELRAYAFFTRDPLMLRTFWEGEDPHAATAAAVLGKDISKVTPEERNKYGKVLNFAIIFQAGPTTIASQSGMGIRAAEKMLQTHKETYKVANQWNRDLVREARKAKPVPHVRTILGRKRRLPDLTHPVDRLRFRAERQCVNTKIQGSAADLIKIAMVRLDRAFEDTPFKLILTVHDELISIAPVGQEPECAAIMEREMTGIDLFDDVPLTAEAKWGPTWAKAK